MQITNQNQISHYSAC